MPELMNLADVKRVGPHELLGSLKDTSPTVSKEAAGKLILMAKSTGLGLKSYLELAVRPELAEEKDRARFAGLSGFEASLAYLNLPFRDDFKQGVFLQAASDTFQKYPGTRAMFPEVIDTMLRWANRQDQIESIAPMISQSRTIAGSEMISTVVSTDATARRTSTVSELAEIPIRTIRTSQTSVSIYKHGSGIQTSYEFERRASLDILTPFANRVARELERSKVTAALGILLNGDTVNPAATAQSFTTYGGVVVGTTALRLQYAAFANWLITNAAAGTPIDTVVGNLKMYLELLFMFTPTINGNNSVAGVMAGQGAPAINVSIPLLNGNVNFALASGMADNYILGFSKGETLEELVEAGSQISENERAITNQSITYVRTENSGFKLTFGDTRFNLNLAA